MKKYTYILFLLVLGVLSTEKSMAFPQEGEDITTPSLENQYSQSIVGVAKEGENPEESRAESILKEDSLTDVERLVQEESQRRKGGGGALGLLLEKLGVSTVEQAQEAIHQVNDYLKREGQENVQGAEYEQILKKLGSQMNPQFRSDWSPLRYSNSRASDGHMTFPESVTGALNEASDMLYDTKNYGHPNYPSQTLGSMIMNIESVPSKEDLGQVKEEEGVVENIDKQYDAVSKDQEETPFHHEENRKQVNPEFLWPKVRAQQEENDKQYLETLSRELRNILSNIEDPRTPLGKKIDQILQKNGIKKDEKKKIVSNLVSSIWKNFKESQWTRKASDFLAVEAEDFLKILLVKSASLAGVPYANSIYNLIKSQILNNILSGKKDTKNQNKESAFQQRVKEFIQSLADSQLLPKETVMQEAIQAFEPDPELADLKGRQFLTKLAEKDSQAAEKLYDESVNQIDKIPPTELAQRVANFIDQTNNEVDPDARDEINVLAQMMLEENSA